MAEPADTDVNIPLEVFIEMMHGATQADAEAAIAERERVRKLADKVRDKPFENWPPFEMAWDTHPSCYHRSQDGVMPKELDGSGVTLMWVTVVELDAVLQPFNLRTKEEIWSVGTASKAARVIVHCAEGRKLSPVWVCPTGTAKLGLAGGNHRLSVARTKGETDIPIIFYDKDETAVAPFFPGRVCMLHTPLSSIFGLPPRRR